MHISQAAAAPVGALPLLKPFQTRSRGIVAGLVICCMLLAAMMAFTGLSLDLSGKGARGLILLILALITVRYALRSSDIGTGRIFRDFAEYTALFITISLLCATASYPFSAASAGYFDAPLARIDALLHFNWLDWYAIVAAHPQLQIAGRIAYANIYFSPLLLLISFAYSAQREQAETFLIAFWVAAIITLMLFLAMPAVGPLSHLWQGHIPYLPTSGTFQADLLPRLRAQSFGAIDLGNLQGLVCAPSFHTTSAIIYMAMGWRIATLRWPLMALNCAMLIATPVEGTHYLTDMIGGAAVALVALAIAHRIISSAPLRMPETLRMPAKTRPV